MKKLIIPIVVWAFWGCEKDPTGNENGDSEIVGNWQGQPYNQGSVLTEHESGTPLDANFSINNNSMDIRLYIYEESAEYLDLVWDYTLNETTSPKQIDMILTVACKSGSNGAPMLGIYKLKDNTLTLATNGLCDYENLPRPTSFDYTLGNGIVWILTKQ